MKGLRAPIFDQTRSFQNACHGICVTCSVISTGTRVFEVEYRKRSPGFSSGRSVAVFSSLRHSFGSTSPTPKIAVKKDVIHNFGLERLSKVSSVSNATAMFIVCLTVMLSHADPFNSGA
jgi:hypothetical protein